MSRPRKYPEEPLERGVRLVFESGRPIAQVAADLGIHPETLRKQVRQAEADRGHHTDLLSTQERERSAGCGRRTTSCAARTRS